MPVLPYTGPEAKLVRTKVGLTDDVDVFDLSTSVDDILLLAWSMHGQRRNGEITRLSQIMITVTFRDPTTGTEYAGTYDADSFAVLPYGVSGEQSPSHRRKVQKLGATSTQPADEPMIQDVGRHEAFGLRLYNIVAAGAAPGTNAYITVQEWG